MDPWVAKKAWIASSDPSSESNRSEALAERAERLEDELAEKTLATQGQLAALLALPFEEQASWLERHSWREDGALLGEALLEAAEQLPVGDRLDLARLAARVAARTSGDPGDTFLQARLDDILGRAGLLEVRALRRRGELQAARQRFAELDAVLETDDTPLRFWLTLQADRSLTAAQLARDEGRLEAATALLSRTARLLRVAGSEEEDFELLTAQVLADLARGAAGRALERLAAAPVFEHRERRIKTAVLEVQSALRTGSPLLARRAFLGLGNEFGGRIEGTFADFYRLLEAAVEVVEGRPAVALETLAEPAARLRRQGSLEGSLRAALVAARAHLLSDDPDAARMALLAGALEHFDDLPATPAIRDALAALREHVAAGAPTPEFLDRLELWLILVVDSPGVAL